MGYTHHTVSLIEPLLHKVSSVCDLGAQNDYRFPLPAPYTRAWYQAKEKAYASIDINGENGSWQLDLSDSLVHYYSYKFDLLVDAGTSEHIGKNGKFSWEAIYNCWLNKQNLTGKYQVNENPKTGNWPDHGFNYYTQDFYRNLEKTGCYKILHIGEHPAMGNTTDGWNVWCVLEKTRDEFITLAEFKKLGLQKS